MINGMLNTVEILINIILEKKTKKIIVIDSSDKKKKKKNRKMRKRKNKESIDEISQGLLITQKNGKLFFQKQNQKIKKK